jgi:hypothetical protein
MAYINILFQHFHGRIALRKRWNKPSKTQSVMEISGPSFTLNVLNNKQVSTNKDNVVSATTCHRNDTCLHTMAHILILKGHRQAWVFKKDGS